MTFISYAQNFEDVMLNRCFGHLENGFYLDLGAWDPVVDSVTKSFYDRGWSGINVEPNEHAFSKLESYRPRDINLKIAVADTCGYCDFWHLPSASGMSTSNRNYAELHNSKGFEVVKSSVETWTLAEICETFAKTPIHFMKIDIEGFEQQALSGANFKKFRPMVVVVESNEPNSKVENYNKWEHILTENEYLFCYGDGLNRFYLANEVSDLMHHFKFPPNVFDNFVRHH